MGELSLTLISCSTEKATFASLLGSVPELILLSGMKVSQPWGLVSNRADPASTSCLPISGMGEGKMYSALYPLLPVTDERADSGVTRVRELALPHTSCSPQETGPCILPGEHNRADPGVGVDAAKPVLKA